MPLSVLFLWSLLSVVPAMAEITEIRVTLLGSGMPVPDPARFGPATLVEAGHQALPLDAGRGVTMHLY